MNKDHTSTATRNPAFMASYLAQDGRVNDFVHGIAMAFDPLPMDDGYNYCVNDMDALLSDMLSIICDLESAQPSIEQLTGKMHSEFARSMFDDVQRNHGQTVLTKIKV